MFPGSHSDEWRSSGVSIGTTTIYICVDDMDIGVKYTLSKFADDTKWSGVINMMEGRDVTQMDLDKLKKQAHAKLLKFNKDKYKVLGWGDPKQRLGTECPRRTCRCKS